MTYSFLCFFLLFCFSLKKTPLQTHTVNYCTGKPVVKGYIDLFSELMAENKEHSSLWGSCILSNQSSTAAAAGSLAECPRQ